MKIYLDYPKGNKELQLDCLRAQTLMAVMGITCYVPPISKVRRPSRRGFEVIKLRRLRGVQGRQWAVWHRSITADTKDDLFVACIDLVRAINILRRRALRDVK